MTNPRFIGILVFCIPAFILVVPGGGEVAFGILAVLGVAHAIKNRTHPLAEPSTRFMSLICWAFLLVAILTVVAAEPSAEGFRRLGTSVHFLFAPFIALLLLATSGVMPRLVQGIKAGAILAGAVALGQLIVRTGEAANGVVNEIILGDLALLLGFLAMVSFFDESRKEKLISALALGLGLTAALLSETRSTWVAAPLLALVLLVIWQRAGHLSTRRIAAALSLAVVIGVAFASTTIFQHRYQQMVTELRSLEDYSEVTSIRERVVMWKAAWKTAQDSPLLGHGLHKANHAVLPNVESDIYRERIGAYTHLHNEFINTLTGKGILGVASLLLLMLGPVFILWKCLKPGEDQPKAAMSILICIGFMIFGLTNLAFGHGIMNTFFVFMLGAMISQVSPEYFLKTRRSETSKLGDTFSVPSETLSLKDPA